MFAYGEKAFGRSGLKLDQADEINAALKEVNGQATRYTVGDVSELVSVAEGAEGQLDGINLPDSSRPSATAVYTTGGGRKYSQYSGAVKGTRATLKRFKDGWRLMSLASMTAYGGQDSKIRVSITQAQRDLAERSTFRDFEIIRERPTAVAA